MATDPTADRYRLVRARTPLRISLGGGGTDVSPYLEDKGGVALTLAIDKYAYATVARQPESDSPLLVQSLDFDQLAQFESEQDLALDGRLDLAKSVIRRLAADRLRTGIEIYMHTDAPPGSATTTTATRRTTTVQSGETLSGIGARTGVDWRTIASLNNISGPNYVVQPGQTLFLDGTTTATAPTAPATTTTATRRTTTVQSGETLSGIGARTGVDWQKIASLNSISGPNYLIQPGQTLFID